MRGVGLVLEGDVITEAGLISGGRDDDFLGPHLAALDACLPASGSWHLFYTIQEVRPATSAAYTTMR